MIRHRARPHKCTGQQPVCAYLLSPFPSLLPCFFLPKPPWSIPFPTFDPSPKHLIVRCLVQSPNAPPLHPIMSPIGSNPPSVQKELWRAFPLTYPDGSHLPPDALLGQPWWGWGLLLWLGYWSSPQPCCVAFSFLSHNLPCWHRIYWQLVAQKERAALD